MKDTSLDIMKLCESWWGRLADATRVEQQAFVRRLLDLLGWEEPLPFSPRQGAAAMGAATYLLQAGNGATTAAFFLPPGALEPPTPLVDRGLDFCPATRVLVEETRSPGVQYLLATDLFRSYLYDLRTDELLLFADEPRTFNLELAPVLQRPRVLEGSLEDLRRQPRSMAARRLREWSQRWIDTLCMRGRIGEETASLALDRLFVMRFLFGHDVMRRTRARLQQRYEALAARAAAPGGVPAGVGADLVRLFHDMWLDWGIDLFAPSADLDAALGRDDIAGPWLAESVLLSRGKLTIATALESFNHGDPSEKMRVRMVPDENEERDQFLARQSLETIDSARIVVDVTEEGYRAVLHWFDKMVALYDRLNLDFDRHARQITPPAREVDLFAWSEIDARRPAACTDRIAHAAAHGLGVYHSDARQQRIVRLLLTMHLISLYHQRREPVDRLPGLGSVLQRRPRVLTPGSIMHGGAAGNAEE